MSLAPAPIASSNPLQAVKPLGTGPPGGMMLADSAFGGGSFTAQLRVALSEALIIAAPTAPGAIGMPVAPLIDIVVQYIGALHTIDADAIRAIMRTPDFIRHIALIAAVDHGKSTLMDVLIAGAGIKPPPAQPRFYDPHHDADSARDSLPERPSPSPARGAPNMLYAMFDVMPDGSHRMTPTHQQHDMSLIHSGAIAPFLINLMSTPNPWTVDEADVAAALRVVDGAVVVIDCIEGVSNSNIDTMVRRAMCERIKLVAFVNKLDRTFLELHMDLETAYQTFSRAIDSVNQSIAQYADPALGNMLLSPQNGTVGFGSGLQGWGFTVSYFARLYCSKFGVSREAMIKKLWGDSFFNPKTKRWTDQQFVPEQNGALNRGFVALILVPINTMFDAVMEGKSHVYKTMCEKLNIALTAEMLELSGKPLLKAILAKWMPATHAVLELAVDHLPSPKVAQKYRVEMLYSGAMNDPFATAMRDCNPTAPLMMYVSRMMPTTNGRYYAFGRVFAGAVSSGHTVRVLGPNFSHADRDRKDLFVHTLARPLLPTGMYHLIEELTDIPAGNLVCLTGIDQYLVKTGTITTHDKADTFVGVRYSTAAILGVAVTVVDEKQLPRFMKALQKVEKTDPLLTCYTAPTGEHMIEGGSELQIELAVRDVREMLPDVKLAVSEPRVALREGITHASTQSVLSKSPNKHHRVSMTAQPMSAALCDALEVRKFQFVNPSTQTKLLTDTFNWDLTDARQVWAFGGEPDHRFEAGMANVFVDKTKGVDVRELKDGATRAFSQATLQGVLCDEPMRGIHFNLQDVVMHHDAKGFRVGQMMPPIKRACYGCQFVSGPVLLEPMYQVDITTPNSLIDTVISALQQRAGVVRDQKPSADRKSAFRAATSATATATAAATAASAATATATATANATATAGAAACASTASTMSRIVGFLPVRESLGFGPFLRHQTRGLADSICVFSHWSPMRGSPLEPGTDAHREMMARRKMKGMKVEIPDFYDFYDKL